MSARSLREWRDHVLRRLRNDIETCADPKLAALLGELAGYPVPPRTGPETGAAAQERRIAIPLRLKSDAGPLSFLGATTVFGTAIDVTLSDVTIEAFFPADARTALAMSALVAAA